MANESYPQYNLKTIVLPYTGMEDSMTLQEYKEKYGIDLRDFIVLEGNTIKLDFGNAQVLLNPLIGTNHCLRPTIIYNVSRYIAEGSDAMTEIAYLGVDPDDGSILISDGIDLKISQSDPFDIDHVLISGVNV